VEAKAMSKVRGVLLDVDGTLVDSNDAHAKAWVMAMAEFGLKIPFGVVRSMIGMGGDKLLPTATGISEETPKGKAITKRRKEIFLKEFLPTLFPTPGAEELLREFKKRGLKMVIATSATAEELDPLLRICRADQVIEAKTSSDDADRSKPDPDIVHAAVENIGLPAKETVMLGDTPYDIESAQKAGVPIIAFRCGGWTDRDLAGAVAIYDHPAQLLHEIKRSVFG
jgi:HAD superfamily hydrolase (TIGR01509 family)